ncbi:TRAP transporter small permease subunit [Flammeovirga kamogawensis]|uniref:TRAP transporter small permease subunit n=1 Tax=Flammeovirga kamogawensis TaxID=373891 RepID=A0ABX8GYE1_9BACT|nr:TRAP transporter small permease subunit [Flammeovirga kamogawensis]MBB6462816.1 TRAP-type mannitol/chloroaromatic compound transport system permease small subunit [Flammeovirga kamogawensis]QWG08399.1 TRAP transporter small permease subunit [Flammeovirga kamogawensis]
MIFSYKSINLLNKKIGHFVSYFSILLIIIVCFDVFSRYVFNYTTAAIAELEWHLFACIFLLNAGNTLRLDKHVRVDALYSNFSPKVKSIVNILGFFIFLSPFCYIIIDASIPYVKNSFIIMETSTDPGGLPFRFLIKACIPISILLLFLQGLSNCIENTLSLFNSSETN